MAEKISTYHINAGLFANLGPVKIGERVQMAKVQIDSVGARILQTAGITGETARLVLGGPSADLLVGINVAGFVLSESQFRVAGDLNTLDDNIRFQWQYEGGGLQVGVQLDPLKRTGQALILASKSLLATQRVTVELGKTPVTYQVVLV
ncbi:hypothetical protein A2160_01670 [Candidatus Beckwithbacteria bacterium RBG_13_42_9]|uniref:Uncharacterized protein n=1 Tax=Candidatus Beckwithbacteria bacterium RBG_13_42_9 TaxID=1797457 RepID=A0A1F5E912_9BACT|nr:MAG: hypothetical protein A2160_01670 [Candidatus Beckwithbacteria bacterium RBG_13_42_9]